MIPRILFLLAFALALPWAAAAEPALSQEPLPASLSESVDAEAPICHAGDPGQTAAVAGASRALAAFGERMRAELEEQGGEAPVVLNNKGYGYGIQNGQQNAAALIQILEREAAAGR